MIIGAAMLAQEDVEENVLSCFSGLDVSLTFRPRGFATLNHRRIKHMLSEFMINPVSIHYPSFRTHERLVDNLKLLSDEYGQNVFVMHPYFGSSDEAMRTLTKMTDEIAKIRATIALENLPGRNNEWYSRPMALYSLDLPFVRMAFDVTHLNKDDDERIEFSSVIDKVEVVHLSNALYSPRRMYHMPIDEGCRDLERFLRHISVIGYERQVILEYMPNSRLMLKDDVAKVKNII